MKWRILALVAGTLVPALVAALRDGKVTEAELHELGLVVGSLLDALLPDSRP